MYAGAVVTALRAVHGTAPNNPNVPQGMATASPRCALCPAGLAVVATVEPLNDLTPQLLF
jgi:hypothetical protein